ncbi:MAG: succinylglutamate desuccinylase/aspartoacylase family protein, partial [Gammaproteobacteria bacterium]|nr:succinylglutamate desuccinylase/aspartoacylase family protein [Gammaproteobacteria bacterium]
PIAVLKNGAGPSAFFSGGVHGDEYEGPVALLNLVRELRAEQLQGRLIVIPSLNLPAALKGVRCSPIDGLNMNRVFPGDREGTVTLIIAHYVCHVLLPMIDIQVDMHSGGTTLEYIPSINMRVADDTERAQKTFDALRTFGAPMGLVDRNLDDTGVLSTVCERRGILNLDTELGGAGRVDRNTVRMASNGVKNLLKHFQMLDGEIVTPAQQGRDATRLAEITDLACYVMAPDAGLYEPFVELGEDVRDDQPLGRIHYVDDLHREPVIVTASRSGFLVCKRPPGRVQRGDNIAIVAQQLQATTYGLV